MENKEDPVLELHTIAKNAKFEMECAIEKYKKSKELVIGTLDKVISEMYKNAIKENDLDLDVVDERFGNFGNYLSLEILKLERIDLSNCYTSLKII